MGGKEVLEQRLDEIVEAIRSGQTSALNIAYELGLSEPYVWRRLKKVLGDNIYETRDDERRTTCE